MQGQQVTTEQLQNFIVNNPQAAQEAFAAAQQAAAQRTAPQQAAPQQMGSQANASDTSESAFVGGTNSFAQSPQQTFVPLSEQLVKDHLKATRTKTANTMYLNGDGKIGSILNLNADKKTYSRKSIVIGHRFMFNGQTYTNEFTIGPTTTKDQLWSQALIYFKPLVTTITSFTAYFNVFEQNYGTFPNDDYARLSSVDTFSTLEVDQKYFNSRMIRAIRRFINAVYGEAERIWTSAEAVARDENYKSAKVVSVAMRFTNRRTPLERALKRVDKDIDKTKKTGKVTYGGDRTVRLKKTGEFSSILYSAFMDLTSTRRSLVYKGYAPNAPVQNYDKTSVIPELENVVLMWKTFDNLNNNLAKTLGAPQFPDVPFFVLDLYGIWDISKSKEHPNFKPISISSISLMRQPFICGVSTDANGEAIIIDGRNKTYTDITDKIEYEIANMKYESLASSRKTIDLIGQLLIGKDFKATNVKDVKRGFDVHMESD